MNRPFIVTVASEKGGVGKTTIATNLAVYLKALHEDLPVTIASFDNHFSIDHMFALGPRPAAGMVELLDGSAAADLVHLGQYGVQYVASARRLTAPDAAPATLRPLLDALDLGGILILDTRPILDWFTEAALQAADLVLTPVKDRAALVNAAALRAVLKATGDEAKLWLVPSLVDARARLNREVKVSDFLAYAARERDYQVADLVISKSPRVESLASGFSTRILPVLTHARHTAVHGQLRQLAEFVLARRHAAPVCGAVIAGGDAPRLRHRLVEHCPVCVERSLDGLGHRFFDVRSRRQGLLHAGCLAAVLSGCELDPGAAPDSLMVLALAGAGMLDAGAELQLFLFDADNRLIATERVDAPERGVFQGLLEGMTGRGWPALQREWLLVAGAADPAPGPPARVTRGAFAARRRVVLREAMGQFR